AEEDAWVEPGNFDRLAAPGTLVEPDDRIALFLDCSKSEDVTGLVACRLSDTFVFTVDAWQRPVGWDAKARGPWRVPRAEVDAKAREALERYDVAWFGI